jgi:hypothetical protein
MIRWAWLCGLAAGGCASVAPVDNPVLVQPAAENPALVAPGQPDAASYAEVYEKIIEVVNDYFEVKPTARYAGHIETLPRVAPGYEQPWKPGSPDPRERLLATFQSIRHIAFVDIWAGERGGYRVTVEVRKELENMNRPERAIYGNALFREATTLDRRAEVVGPQSSADGDWIPVGRDYAFEQLLLRRIQEATGCR